jgi:hypothetical protein
VNYFIYRQFHKLFIVTFAISFTDGRASSIKSVRIVKVVLPGDHSSWSGFVSGQIVCKVSSVVVFVLLNEFHSASCVSVAALSADGASFPPPVVVALMLTVVSRVVRSSDHSLEVLDLVVLASVSPLAAHRDSVSSALLAADLDFANLLVVQAQVIEAVVLAIVDGGAVAGPAGALVVPIWVS